MPFSTFAIHTNSIAYVRFSYIYFPELISTISHAYIYLIEIYSNIVVISKTKSSYRSLPC